MIHHIKRVFFLPHICFNIWLVENLWISGWNYGNRSVFVKGKFEKETKHEIELMIIPLPINCKWYAIRDREIKFKSKITINSMNQIQIQKIQQKINLEKL